MNDGGAEEFELGEHEYFNKKNLSTNKCHARGKIHKVINAVK